MTRKFQLCAAGLQIRAAKRSTKFRFSTSVTSAPGNSRAALSFLSRSRPNQLAAGINANCRVCKLHVCISTYRGSCRMAFTRNEYENSHPPTLTSKNNFNVVFLFLSNFLASADCFYEGAGNLPFKSNHDETKQKISEVDGSNKPYNVLSSFVCKFHLFRIAFEKSSSQLCFSFFPST